MLKKNEQRTQGKWYCEDGSFEVRQTSFQRIGIMDSITGQVNNTQRTANAQYTALAVNNLAPLADTLAWIENEIKTTPDELMEALQGAILIKIKEALTPIS